MSHILAICRVIELQPVELFQIALKPRPGQRGPLLRRLEALLPYARADEPLEPRPNVQDVQGLLRQVQETVERLNELMREATLGRKV